MITFCQEAQAKPSRLVVQLYATEEHPPPPPPLNASLPKCAIRGSRKCPWDRVHFLNAPFWEHFSRTCSLKKKKKRSLPISGVPKERRYREQKITPSAMRWNHPFFFGVGEPNQGSKWLQKAWLGFVRIKTLTPFFSHSISHFTHLC
jgi:hypothetical protein